MPFKAAKAVAATFCYNVRHALTPLFGEDFIGLCVHPSDRNFASFRIDSQIVHECTMETQSWLSRTDARHTPTPSLYSSPDPSASEACATPKFALSAPFRFKKLKPKIFKGTDSESGYGTDSEVASDKFVLSPDVSPKTTIPEWTAVNNNKASPKEATAIEGLQMLSWSPVQRSTEVTPRSPAGQRNSKRPMHDTDDEYAGDESTTGEDDVPHTVKPASKALRTTESRAAYWLMQLSMEDAKHRDKRARRASIN